AASKITKKLPKTQCGINKKIVENFFYMFEVTKDELIRIVKQMKGYDEIPMNIIYRIMTNIAQPLAINNNKQ
ncbi:hypothetical protein WA026_021090, partial [Henosepilachna vigintioctopunctata]